MSPLRRPGVEHREGLRVGHPRRARTTRLLLGGAILVAGPFRRLCRSHRGRRGPRWRRWHLGAGGRGGGPGGSGDFNADGGGSGGGGASRVSIVSHRLRRHTGHHQRNQLVGGYQAGAVNVRVVTPAGTSVITGADQFQCVRHS
jgi:hypothetical protein